MDQFNELLFSIYHLFYCGVTSELAFPCSYMSFWIKIYIHGSNDCRWAIPKTSIMIDGRNSNHSNCLGWKQETWSILCIVNEKHPFHGLMQLKIVNEANFITKVFTIIDNLNSQIKHQSEQVDSLRMSSFTVSVR